jgi:short-subunit dehydrogenase
MSEGLARELKPLGIGVSVLCPGFVRTRISESARNRPERYGVSQPPGTASAADQSAVRLAQQTQTGLDPAAIAARDLAAIHEDELYVFTHTKMRGEVDARFAAIQAALDRAGC